VALAGEQAWAPTDRNRPKVKATIMKTSEDASFPYRIDAYRPDQFGSPAGKQPLVVVHGYSAQVYPMQAFMHVLADQLPEYCVYQYSFETFGGLTPDDVSLEEASRVLGAELLRVKHEHGLADGVAFVGHSTGGLIARRCFVDYRKALGSGTFVFLGTPHHGAEIADWKNLVTRLRHEKQTRELAAGSDFIWRLNRDWHFLGAGEVEKVLCVIGTSSNRSGLGRIPKGNWVQSDGVVRATSAAIAPRHAEACILLHVPLEHSSLKDIDPLWQRAERISRGLFEGPPVPSRDLPFIAAIGFLKSPQPQQEGDSACKSAALWRWCCDYLETCEREWRERIYASDYFEETEPGKWQEIADAPDPVMRKVGLEPPSKFSELPKQPTFQQDLTDYVDRAVEYWRCQRIGTALIRLEYLHMPPAPILLDVVDTNNASELDALKTHPSTRIRMGARWATLYIPEIAEGTHRVIWQHGNRRIEASFSITRHLTTIIQIDAGTGRVADFTGNVADVARQAVEEWSELKRVAGTRQWDLEIDQPWIDVSKKV
jgi:pimeloyl-ACP methyl ester carboxylesterase